VLELGIGRRNMLIKAPTMDMISKLNNWSYITFNMPEEINIANDIKDRSLAIKGDITNSLSEILQVNR
nr:NAD-dependent protein deacetylase, SIR2 family [Lachnospira sp.]